MSTNGTYPTRLKRDSSGSVTLKIWGVVFAAIGAAVVVGTILYKAGRMPNDEDMDKVRATHAADTLEMRRDVRALEHNQVQIQTEIKTMIRSQESIHQKLDKALDADTKPRRR